MILILPEGQQVSLLLQHTPFRYGQHRYVLEAVKQHVSQVLQ